MAKEENIEKKYKRFTQLQHILHRPDSYLGSVESVEEKIWLYNEEGSKMINKLIKYVPGLFKMFDEIIVNAADNKRRCNEMDCIKIDINQANNCICVWNNGKGIPIIKHKEENMYIPSLIFGHMLTSSNFDDNEYNVSGGRNGVGAKICNIFSTKFTVETVSNDYNKYFKQTWFENMSNTVGPEIGPCKGTDYTRITFYPDLSRFKMTELDNDIVALMGRRAYDLAGCIEGVKVYLNNKMLPIENFMDYVNLYIKDKLDEYGKPLKIVNDKINDHWEVALTISDNGFKQISFVNNIATTQGGRHVDHICDQLTSKVAEVVKKLNKGGKDIKLHQIKSHLWLFINCLITNAAYDSQSKQLMITNVDNVCPLPETFIGKTLESGIVETMMSWIKFKAQTELCKKVSGKKVSNIKGVPKLEDANYAGSDKSIDCTLIVTEGDSAKSLAVSGLSVVGHDKYGIYPLQGKILNTREATHEQLLHSVEINNLIKILGLQLNKKYETIDDLKTLRYGRLMLMTDQDQDGSHIKGLLINFIHHNWPELLHLPFLEEFITPIVKASKGKENKSFYSLPEFENWKNQVPNWPSYKVKYYKGLGTSTAKEAKEYFTNIQHHRIEFQYAGINDDLAIEMAFCKTMVELRKEWLKNGMEERKRRREVELPELYLYGKETKTLTYSDFINQELILYSIADNVRSIPSLVDGLKPSQRKIIFTCFKRNDKREVKVSQLAGSVAENSAYHHGELSLNNTIINLAQNFVGSNNINLLLPIGQFGTRIEGGKDAASSRYIFTMLNPVTKTLFPSKDFAILNYLFDDNLKIEPDYYVPIIPLVLVNGASGIGTGWKTQIPNYNPRDLVENIYHMLRGEELKEMIPWYKNFRGTIERFDRHHYIVSGEISLIGNNEVEITELPIRFWTQSYKESVLEPMLHGYKKSNKKKDKGGKSFIIDYKEYHTDTTVKYIITMTPEKLKEALTQGLHKVFKLQTTIVTTNMVLFDTAGCIKTFDSCEEILKNYFDIRFVLYERRKKYLIGALEAEALKLQNQVKFILDKIANNITIENKTKDEMLQTLQEKHYDSDPVKTYQKNVNKKSVSEDKTNKSGPDYDYILGMTLWILTQENKEELLKKWRIKVNELEDLKSKTVSDLWIDDLKIFVQELDDFEKKEREEMSDNIKIKEVDEPQQSSYRERIIPSISNYLKKKLEKKPPGEPRKRKLKEVTDEVKEASFVEQVAGTKDKNSIDQTTLNFEGSKKNQWSDSEEDPSDISDMDLDEDNSLIESQKVVPAANKTKHKFDCDEANSVKSIDSEEHIDADSPPSQATSEPKEELGIPTAISDSDDD